MASVRALEDSRLLRLDQEPFYELLTDRHEVARALMHSVVNSLRARTSDLAVLQRRIDALERDHRSSDGG
jgi:CRP-like cAMP-binding protein